MSRWCSNQLSYEPISIFQRLALCNDALAPVAISLKNALEAPKERHSKGSALKNQDLGHMASSRAFFSRLAQGASAKTVRTIRRARSDTGKITEKCSKALLPFGRLCKRCMNIYSASSVSRVHLHCLCTSLFQRRAIRMGLPWLN